MSATLVTQCPNCQTRFRLSDEQLSAAAGNVRCGACLQVYNALAVAAEQQRQKADDNKPSSHTPAPAAEPPPESAPSPLLSRVDSDDFLIHDDLDFDELDLEALGRPAGGSSQGRHTACPHWTTSTNRAELRLPALVDRRIIGGVA